MIKKLLPLFIFLFATFSDPAFAQLFQEQGISGLPSLRHAESQWVDFNNNGRLDLLVTGETIIGESYIATFRNNGDNTFTRTGTGLVPVKRAAIAVADYNRDGLMDILITGLNDSNARSTVLYRNNGNFSFEAIDTGFIDVAYGGLAFKDMNNNGLPDVVLNGWNQSNIPVFRMYKNTGNGFEEVNTGIPGTAHGRVIAFDYNNNGLNDILITGLTTTNQRITRVYRNNGDLSFSNINAPFEGVNQGDIAVADLDNDGYQDIILSGINTSNQPVLKVYMNNEGDNTFSELDHSMPGVSVSSLAVGDMNNDGWVDIVLTGADVDNNYITRLFLNNGNNTFTSQAHTFPGVINGSVALGDYNNDLKPDIAIFGLMLGGLAGRIYQNVNSTTPTVIQPPDNLSESTSGNTATLSWSYNSGSVPFNIYTYELYIGTSSGTRDILSPPSDLSTGKARVSWFGSFNPVDQVTINELPPGSYYWGVQAVDPAGNRSVFADEQSFTITPADFTGVTFEDGSFVFDGTEKSIEISGTLPEGASVTYENNTRTNVGSQEATAIITGDNFNTLVLTAELEITPSGITGITFEDGSFVFDGTEKTIEITGTLPDGASVSYENNSRTNVGSQEATATITGSNFTTVVLTAVLTITPADIQGITFEDASFVFDGTEKSIEITGPLPDGTSVIYENNTRINVGTQEATAIITGSNFSTLVFTAELTITPAGGDRRVMAGNASIYNFTADDFGLADPSYSIRVESVAGGGALSGVPGDEFTTAQLNDGGLTFTGLNDEHGYGYLAIEFTIIDEQGLESEQTYTLSIDLAAASLELTGGEGWRFLSSPAAGETISGFLEPVWTQGFPGSDNPSAVFTNVLTLDQQNYGWDEDVDASDELTRGQSLLVYVFEDHNNDGSQVGFPRRLHSLEQWAPLSDVFEFSGLEFYADHPGNPDSFVLLANPHPVSVDFCEMVDAATNIAASVYIWDPNHNAGDYINLSCAAGDDVHIAPFQGFWVRTTAGNPQLSIPEEAYLSGAVDGYYKRHPGDRFLVSLQVSSEQTGLANQLRILFSEEGTPGLDHNDAPKLSPAGLAQTWMNLHALDDDGRGYALRSLPLPSEALAKGGLPAPSEETTVIPLDIQTTEGGEYTLTWSLPQPGWFSGRYYLRDTHSGTLTELTEGQSYRFTIEDSMVAKATNSPLKRGAGGG